MTSDLSYFMYVISCNYTPSDECHENRIFDRLDIATTSSFSCYHHGQETSHRETAL